MPSSNNINIHVAGEHALQSSPLKHDRRRCHKAQHRSVSRLVRANAKHLAETGHINIFPACDHDHSQLEKAKLRPHLEKDLREHYKNLGRCAFHDHTPRPVDEQDDGRDLAYSDIQLPSDRHRLARRPTLEREDAFCDASTSSRGSRIHTRRRLETGNDDQQVADLYRMGLLYDGEQDRAAAVDAFNLNSIKHEEPLYSIRPAKRTRKHGRSNRAFKSPLHLDLSFSDLGNEEDLAQYLVDLTQSGARVNSSQDGVVQRPRASSTRSSEPPLRVVYELSSSQPSYDVDTSQPPTLIIDTLSDYDYFSDADMDDTPSQTEMREHEDSPPSDAWILLGDST